MKKLYIVVFGLIIICVHASRESVEAPVVREHHQSDQDAQERREGGKPKRPSILKRIAGKLKGTKKEDSSSEATSGAEKKPKKKKKGSAKGSTSTAVDDSAALALVHKEDEPVADVSQQRLEELRDQVHAAEGQVKKVLLDTFATSSEQLHLMEIRLAEITEAADRFRSGDKDVTLLTTAAQEATAVGRIAAEAAHLDVQDRGHGAVGVTSSRGKVIVQKTSLLFLPKVLFTTIVHCYRRFKLNRVMYKITDDNAIQLAEAIRGENHLAWRSGTPNADEVSEAKVFIKKNIEIAADLKWEQYVSSKKSARRS